MKALLEMDLTRAMYRDRVRDGGARRREAEARTADEVVIRTAGDSDAGRLKRLAQLDSAPVPAGPTLVAEVDGLLVAALPLYGGRAVADPFMPTAGLVRMLELRAAQVRAVG
jgi:hypothetical protein